MYLLYCYEFINFIQIENLSMKESLDFNYLFKFIIVGDSSVGKSTFLSTFMKKPFNNESYPTMGVEFATRRVQIGHKIVKLQIWDTAGQQAFRTITRAYYKNAIGVILLYDLTNPKSVESLEGWVDQIQENANQNIEIVIIGNKKDIYDGSQIQYPSSVSELKRYMTSAKTGQNVSKVFNELAYSILTKIQKGHIDPDGITGIKKGNSKSHPLKLSDSQDNESSSCC